MSGILSTVTADRTWGLTDTVSGTAATTDTMAVTLISPTAVAADNTYSALSTTAIENFNFRFVDGLDAANTASVGATGFNGATKFAVKNSSVANTATTTTDDTFSITGAAAAASLELANNSRQLNVNYTNAGTATSGDALTVAFGGGATGDLTLADAAGDGFVTVNATTATAASTLQKLAAGTDFTTLTVTGDQALTITDALASTVTTINAGSNSGAVKVIANSSTLTATGGTDTADQLTLNTIPTGTISGFETVVVGAANSTLSLANVTDATKLGVASGLTSAVFTNAAATTNTINLSGNYQNGAALTTSTSLTTGTVAYTPVSATTVATDTLTVAVDNGGTANTGTYTAGALTATNVENLTLTTADWTNVAIGGITQTVASTVAGSVTASGASNLALGTIANIGGLSQTTGVDTYNFGGVTGTLSATMAGTGSLSVTGAAGADTITATTAMTSDATVTTQTYNLGTGDDRITFTSGTTTLDATHVANKLVLNGGAGTDQFAVTTAAAMNTDEVTIAGGDGTDTLAVTAIDKGSLTVNSFSGVEALTISGTGMANAAVTDGVFFNVATGYADAMSITDVTGTDVNRVSFTVASSGAASLANLTFTGFAPGTDLLELNGQGGNESLTGSSGIDRIYGDAGNDTMIGGAGADLLIGSTGNDSVSGGDGADAVIGGAGVDQIALGAGADVVHYAASATDLVAYAGADTTTANIEKISDFVTADDTITLASGATFAGLALVGGTTGVSVNESSGTLISATPIAITAGAASITALTALMETAATGVASTAAAAGAATGLQAYTFATAAGAGAFDGKTYLVINDATAAIAATDVILDMTGVTGTIAAADITVSASGTGAYLAGTSGADAITGGADVDTILGGAGNDTITGGAGADNITGGAGADDFVFSGLTTATNGADTITAFSVAEGDQFDLPATMTTLANAVVGTAITTATALALATHATSIAVADNAYYVINQVANKADIDSAADIVTALADGGVLDAVDIAQAADNVSTLIITAVDAPTTTYIYGFTNDAVAATVDAAELVLIGTVTNTASVLEGATPYLTTSFI